MSVVYYDISLQMYYNKTKNAYKGQSDMCKKHAELYRICLNISHKRLNTIHVSKKL